MDLQYLPCPGYPTNRPSMSKSPKSSLCVRVHVVWQSVEDSEQSEWHNSNNRKSICKYVRLNIEVCTSTTGPPISAAMPIPCLCWWWLWARPAVSHSTARISAIAPPTEEEEEVVDSRHRNIIVQVLSSSSTPPVQYVWPESGCGGKYRSGRIYLPRKYIPATCEFPLRSKLHDRPPFSNYYIPLFTLKI